MSKALVIKGANFAVNKVTTVELEDIVPCTGLALSQSTIAFTALNATEQLTATKTPVGATDPIIWLSSDTDVATVSDNGLVTCVGIGSATITASCGEQTAECIITSAVTIVLDDVYHAENGARYSSSLELPTKDHIGRTTGTNSRLYYSTDVYGTYQAFVLTSFAGQYLIPIPKGTTKMTITPPEGMQYYTYLVLGDANTKQTYVGGADGKSAKGIKGWGYNSTHAYPKEVDISQWPDANGFIMSVSTPSADASTITGKTTVTFS